MAGRTVSADEATQEAFFERSIRPVLVKHCYKCHSADAKALKGKLRLDSAKGLHRGGDSGSAVVPGSPDESPLIQALRYEGLEMPPSGKLPTTVVNDFVRWVEMGAFDPRQTETPFAQATKVRDAADRLDHWAWQAIRNPVAPSVVDKKWPATEIDRFVLARLESEGLRPAPDADQTTLVRRLYYDLTGLPPSPQQLQAALEDHSSNAWEQLVDRLLASPQFGVHWGRYWLDVARYADSNGSDFNATFHNAWRYRNYVFDSFNCDKPFNEFVREQIAGDLLPFEDDEDRTENIVATGFLMIGAKMLSERDKEKLTMDVVDEQINTVGQAFMGLTIGCARCHDHKFDPIPTRDYYALAGIFKSTRTLQGESQKYVSTWPRRKLPADETEVAAVAEFEQEQKKLQSSIAEHKKFQTELEGKLNDLLAGERYLVVDDQQARLIGSWKDSKYSPKYVGRGYIHDDQSEKGRKFAEFSLNIPTPARYEVQVSYTSGDNRSDRVPVSIRHAEGEDELLLNQQVSPAIDNLFASVGQFRFETGQPAVITIATRGTEGYVIVDAVRLVELNADGKPARRTVSEKDAGVQKAKEELAITEAELEQLQSDLKQLEDNAPSPLPKAIAVAEANEIRDCNICIRGEHQNLGRVVPRGTLTAVTHVPFAKVRENESGRLQLANWIAHNNHPLTARVIVNRIWHHLIGEGIVASVDNFGRLGHSPSHPDLLDKLATEFIRDGWSVKRAIRRIVLSRTYQMSTRHNEKAWEFDPANRLLWRAHRKNVPAESIRDAMLAISGELDLESAGSPVAGLGTLVTQNKSEQQDFEPSQSNFRSAFLPIIRSEIPDILLTFDFADPDLVTGKRAKTNVPAQALLLMNSPFVMERAALAADRIEENLGPKATGNAKVTSAYQLVLCRPPSESDLVNTRKFLNSLPHDTDGPSPLAQLVHMLFASTEFRMLD